jgi:hypothetical protein
MTNAPEEHTADRRTNASHTFRFQLEEAIRSNGGTPIDEDNLHLPKCEKLMHRIHSL